MEPQLPYTNTIMKKIKHIETNALENGDYIVRFQDRYFQVGEIMYDILNFHKNNVPIKEMLSYIEEKHQYPANEEEIEQSIQDFEDLLETESCTGWDRSITRIARIVNLEKFKYLLWLFSKTIPQRYFEAIFLLLLCINGYFVLKITDYSIMKAIYIMEPILQLQNWWYWIVLYIIILATVFIHEMYHVAAAKKHNVKVKEVGIGYYMLSIVFYADLTDLWRHNKNVRIIANLSGIYSQLGIGIAVIALHCFIKMPSIVDEVFKILIVINFTNALYNLIPFFKTDGYWVLSDYFNISNLREASFGIIKDLKDKSIRYIINNNSNVLLIYTVCSAMFFVFFFSYFAYHLTVFFIQYDYVEVSFRLILNCFLTILFLYTLYFRVLKRLKKI